MTFASLNPAVLALSLALPVVLPRVAAPAATALQPAAPSAPAVAGAPERVQITTEDKLSLVGSFYAPKDTKQKVPGALLVHDSSGQRGDLEALAVRLQKQGFAVLTFDLRGHGESATATLDWSKLDDEAKARTWSTAPLDVKAGAEYLRTLPTVHATSLSLAGYRDGGSLVARHAVRDEGVRDLVLIDPQPDSMGFALVKDLEELSGLPTYIAVGRTEQPLAKRLTEAAQRAVTDKDFIEVLISKGESSELLADKKMLGDLSKWMLDKALPKKVE